MAPIPPLIRRNTLYLSAAQALHSIILQLNVVLAALVLLQLSGSPALAGLGGGVVWGGRILIVYESGRMMDRFGRRIILILGVALSAGAIVLLGFSALYLSTIGFLTGLVVFGVGTGVMQQNRVAVADMYPTTRRAEAVGSLFTASVVGAILATFFISSAVSVAYLFKFEPFVLSYFASLPILGSIATFIWLVKPDPRDIAKDLHLYYGEAQITHSSGGGSANPIPIMKVLAYVPLLIAFMSSALAQGNMTMIMALVPLVLHSHHIDVPSISLSVTIHFLGMYALALLLGRLADRVGRKKVLIAAGLISGVGSLLTPATPDFWAITVGTFLVGLGWSGATVATTALMADVTEPLKRGQVIGANDTFMAITALIFPFVGGLLIQEFGFIGLGLFGFFASIVAVLLPLGLKEVKPGIYEHGHGRVGVEVGGA